MVHMVTSSTVPGIELAPGIWTDRSELRFGFSRSRGPGGQNVNKVNSKTELRIRPEALHGLAEKARVRLREAVANRITADGDILIISDSGRTQESNRQECLKRLGGIIATALVEPKIRRKSRPTKGSVTRRLDQKRARGEVKKQRSAAAN